MTLSQAQELREAVLAFRAGGKPAVAWAETFGEFGPGTAPYVLATGFEEIWLQPSGDVGLLGAAAGATFLRGGLDKAGIEPQLDRRHEYKNAADMFLSREFTDAHREATDRLAESAYEQVVAAVAEGRGLAPERVRELVDRAPVMADEALAARLVDRLGYRDEVYAELRRRIGTHVKLLYLARYSAHRSPLHQLRRAVRRGRPRVALVAGSGAIRQGRSGRSPLSGPAMGSDTVTAALRAAARDDDVRAVVFRVNSPGGSYVASDAVWREVGQTRATGKTVVVSMGQLAASGGYFVSAGADVIVALPGTLTGSIGVLGGKFVVNALLDRVGVAAEMLGRGAHARMFSPTRRFDEGEWDRLQAWLDRVYDDFVARVAAGRRLSRERVHELARGRVWTGADARVCGLVDELGGLSRAATIARDRAGLPADAELRPYPAVPAVRRLRRPHSSEDPAAASVEFSGWGAFAELAAALRLPAAGPLTMPPVRLGEA